MIGKDFKRCPQTSSCSDSESLRTKLQFQLRCYFSILPRLSTGTSKKQASIHLDEIIPGQPLSLLDASHLSHLHASLLILVSFRISKNLFFSNSPNVCFISSNAFSWLLVHSNLESFIKSSRKNSVAAAMFRINQLIDSLT